MPFYDYKCPECENVQTGRSSIADRKDNHPPCQVCGAPTDYVFIPTTVGIVLKGGDFPGKNLRVKRQMEKKNADLDLRQRERYGDSRPTLAPNVDGERVDSWSDAKKLAKEKGHDTSNYDQKVKNLVKGQG